jgi:hypothetical protein
MTGAEPPGSGDCGSEGVVDDRSAGVVDERPPGAVSDATGLAEAPGPAAEAPGPAAAISGTVGGVPDPTDWDWSPGAVTD